MIQIDATLDQLLQSVEQNGVCVEKEIHGYPVTSVDVVFPHVMVLLCLRGTARIMFDMQEFVIEKNDFGIIPPGHFLQRISCSEDYTLACVLISAEMYEEAKAHTFSHEHDKFNYAPICRLTDEQAQHVMALNDIMEAIASHDTNDLQLRQQMLLSHLAVGLEFINYYRREQDREWAESRSAKLYTQFCDLVIEHYRENRNVNFYANLMDYDPRYFSKVFRQFSGGHSPLEWIQQYVATQAKRIMDMHPKQTVKETAYQLGFPDTANFCRYFKRATGIYPQEYKKRMYSKTQD
jgi:AraC-like DNA-binding protein